jgi:hypothetical protein
MYQCVKSFKCISKRHLFDLRRDCPHGDDENRTAVHEMILEE